MAVEWNKYYTEDEIKRLQEIELCSLDVFCKVCSDLGIRFYLYGGSLLGAVKYKGFVPWDDDLDIAMLREDYERFIREAPSLMPEEYEIQHPRLVRRSPYHYTKVRRKDTALVEYRNHKVKINHGVYFDVYPLDCVPDDYQKYIAQKIAYDKWVSIFQIRQNYHIDTRISSVYDFARVMIRWCQCVIAHIFSVPYLIGKIDRIAQRYNGQQSQFQGCLSFPYLGNYFDGVESIDMAFEGRNICTPSGYKVNLKNRYGDIDIEPPEKKRVGHKPYILDLGSEK